MIISSPIASSSFAAWRAAAPVSPPAFDAAAPVRTDGRNMDGLQRVLQSIHPSVLASLDRAERGLPWFSDTDSFAVDRAQPSVLTRAYTRAYEWCADTVSQVFGASREAQPSARSGEAQRQAWSVEVEPLAWSGGRELASARDVSEQFSSPGARERRSVSADDFLRQVASRRQQPQPSDAGVPGGGSLEDFLGQVDAHPQQPQASLFRGGTLDDAFERIGGFPRWHRCGTYDRSAGVLAYLPGNVLPTMCPELRRTYLSTISFQQMRAAGRVQRTLIGHEEGVLSCVRVAIPAGTVTLTVKVSREGGTPETGTWNMHTGIGGIVARVMSTNQRRALPNLANCMPAEPRTGQQVCTIPVERGRVDGKRFVTVEVFATRAGEPILLDIVASRGA